MTQVILSNHIFVQIASYRDPECIPTLKSIFKRAIHPERIHVGLCWQYQPTEDPIFENPLPEYAKQVSCVMATLDETQGAGWARNKAQTLWNGEEYVLQIHAHTLFEQGWDNSLIEMLNRCNSEKPVITGWLPNYIPPSRKRCPVGMIPRYYIKECINSHPQLVHLAFHYKPIAECILEPSPSWVGNFMFSRYEAFCDVPFDPYIHFWGEELNYSARLWTHGYDFFQFDKIVAHHYWYRDNPKDQDIYRDIGTSKNQRSLKRNLHLFGLNITDDAEAIAQIDDYPIGQKRMLAEYWLYCGINLEKATVLPHAKSGNWRQNQLDITFKDNGRKAKKHNFIFVAIPSYRDTECQHTVKDLFDKAKHTERIRVGICWQYDKEKDAACFTVPCPYPDQVRINHHDTANSKGANWARADALSLAQEEEYTLLIDAHMRFNEGWDETLIQRIKQCDAEEPVLTYYCPHYETDGNKYPRLVRRICVERLGGANDPQLVHLIRQIINAKDTRNGLYASPFVVQHFIFARSAVFRHIPIDPHITFWGDEITLSARLWTHGIDVFQLENSVAHHHWTSRDRPKVIHYTDINRPANQLAKKRVRHLLQLEQSDDAQSVLDIGRYALGTKRKLEDFWEFAGIDPRANYISRDAAAGRWNLAVKDRYQSKRESSKPRIFVAIPSYRDPECAETLKDLYAQAANPERVFVGICLQLDSEEDAELPDPAQVRPAQVRTLRVEASESKGANWARAQALGLREGEEFILLCDSHMRFEQGWDEKLLQTYAEVNDRQAVLTYFPPAYHPPRELAPPHWRTRRIRVNVLGQKNESQLIHLTNQVIKPDDPRSGIYPSPFVAFCFIFAPASAFAAVPIDPHIHFWGDEISYSARLWTHGYNIYQTQTALAYHQWFKKDTDGKTAYKKHDNPRNVASRKRVRHLLRLPAAYDKDARTELEHYGLGTKRLLADFWKFAGVDLAARSVSPDAKKGFWNMEIRERYMKQESGAYSKQRIFVAIPSYRDGEAARTVEDLFASAAHPERVSVGICWQADEQQDPGCFKHAFSRPNQVRQKHYKPGQSQGSGWARLEALGLMQGEEYVLLLDAHARLTPGWDDALLAMHGELPSKKTLITTLLKPLASAEKPVEASPLRIMVENLAAPENPSAVQLGAEEAGQGDARSGLYPTPVTPLHLLFGPARAFQDVPPDPYIYHDGAPVTYSARLWTHGWELAQPDRALAWRPAAASAPKTKEYKTASPYLSRLSRQRARHLLALELCEDEAALKEIDRFGHGVERDVDSFWHALGVDAEKRTLAENARKGLWKELLSGETGQLTAAPARPRIFVAIASYRDPDCQNTVKDLFEKAKYPDRIFAGIVWQTIPEEDADCFRIETRPEQVRTKHFDARESKGACWARSEMQKLWDGEEYTLQIDSHMRFEPDWDEVLLDMFQECGNQKAVISSYPPGFTPPDELKRDWVYGLCAKEFNPGGIFTMKGKGYRASELPAKPPLGAFIGACFLFGPSQFMRDVPYDPHLYFFGEEISLSVRLWTHGYDIYYPNKRVAYHDWNRKGRKNTHFSDHKNWSEANRRSYQRVKYLLAGEAPKNPAALEKLDQYGLGTVRTLKEYQEFAGVDFAARTYRKNAADGVFPAPVNDNPIVEPKPAAADAKQQEVGASPQPTPPVEESKPVIQAVKPPPLIMPSPQPAAITQNNPNILYPVAGEHGHNIGPIKTFESPEAVVYDNFLPDDIYDRMYNMAVQMDYQHINTTGKISRVWNIDNGFPLRSANNVFYHTYQKPNPKPDYVYPSGRPLDRFIEHLLPQIPKAEHIVGKQEKDWEHFSITSWIYPPGTGLSLHNDGSTVYTGAFVYFLSPMWRLHWGGLLLLMSREANRMMEERRRGKDGYTFYKKKWLHESEHDDFAMEAGYAQCIFPKRNRLVFIANDAYHMVTKVNPAAGDNMRISFAGFFNKPKKAEKK